MKCARCGNPLAYAGAGCAICAAFDAGRASTVSHPPARNARRVAVATLSLVCVAALGAATIMHFRGAPSLGSSRSGHNGHTSIFGSSASGETDRPLLAMNGSSDAAAILDASGNGDGASVLTARGSDSSLGAMSADGGSETPSIMSARGQADPPTMEAKGNGGSPTMTATDDPVTMPDDIRRWLEHLERIERQRNTMATQQMMQAVTTMARLQGEDLTGAMSGDDDDNAEAVNRKMNARANSYISDTEGMRRMWTQLMSDFHSLQPPSECVGIRNSYDQVISNTGAMILEINDAVRSAAQNRQKALQVLMGMQGRSNDRIDRPAKDADGGVEGVCRRYNTRKWFDIKSDVGSGVMSQIGF